MTAKFKAWILRRPFVQRAIGDAMLDAFVLGHSAGQIYTFRNHVLKEKMSFAESYRLVLQPRKPATT